MVFPFNARVLLWGALASAPFLLGANGGCDELGGTFDAGAVNPGGPCVSVNGGPCGQLPGHAPRDSGACLSGLGGRCGGNTADPCTCDTGLVCTPGDSGLPFGDVGGTCEPPAAVCDPGVGCPVGSSWDIHTCACAQLCQVATDCTGALPALCALCPSADGGTPITRCAHFVCIGGFCQNSFCD